MAFCVFAAWYAVLHVSSARYFPLPWPDESSFLWPAISLAETGSLLTPELMERHHPMWMPPGHMLVNALVFRLFGFSFELARALCAVEILGLFAGLVWFNRRSRAPLASTLLCGVFLLSTHFVAAGNIARMEALLLCLLGGALPLLGSGRILAGLALLAMTPLVHPNGIYFMLAGITFALASSQHRARLFQQNLRSHGREWLVVILCLAFWLSYAAYAISQWSDFVVQMSAQLERKMMRDSLAWLMTRGTLIFAISAATCLICGWWRSPRVLLLSCLASAAWTAPALGLETWYAVYRELAFLLLSLAALELACDLGASYFPPQWARSTAVAVSSALLVLHWAAGSLPFPPGSPARLLIHGMRPRPDIDYAPEHELARVLAALSPFEGCREPVTIRVFPRADSLLLYERLERGLFRFSSPPYLLRQLDREYEPLPWDIYLFHVIRHPSWLKLPRKFELRAAGVDPDSREHLLFETPDASRWYMRVREARIREKCGTTSGDRSASRRAAPAERRPPER